MTAGIEIGAGTGQSRAALGEVGGATVQQGWEEVGGDIQGEEAPETGVGVGAGQMVVWKGPKEDAAAESGAEGTADSELEEAERGAEDTADSEPEEAEQLSMEGGVRERGWKPGQVS